MHDQPPSTDLGAAVRRVVDAPLHPGALAAAICNAIGDQFTLYANYEAQAANRSRNAGDLGPAATSDGTATAYRRAATQMRDLARMLTLDPANPGPWQRAINTAPDLFQAFLARVSAAEGVYADAWRDQIWPAMLQQLDDLVRAHGGTIAERINVGQPA